MLPIAISSGYIGKNICVILCLERGSQGIGIEMGGCILILLLMCSNGI